MTAGTMEFAFIYQADPNENRRIYARLPEELMVEALMEGGFHKAEAYTAIRALKDKLSYISRRV